MKKVFRYEEVSEENVISLGEAIIEAVDENESSVIKGKGVLHISVDTPTIKNIQVEIFMEKYENSAYIYAGDAEGNLYEHLNGYVGLWIKRGR
jgi:hypothetical protein